MSEQFEKINSNDLLYVVTSRGAIDAEKGCALLQLSVADSMETLPECGFLQRHCDARHGHSKLYVHRHLRASPHRRLDSTMERDER